MILEGAGVLLVALILTSWFAGWPGGVGANGTSLVALAVLGAARATLARPSSAAVVGALRPLPETAACLGVAVLYRLPALLHPWGFVNKDGAFGAFIAIHLLAGLRPAPVFTEGATYQGSLKGQLSALLALLTGSRDFAFLMLVTSVLLYLAFLVASMALVRRLSGRWGAAATGLYLALGPKFLTTFSLNCVGQYMDVLALGGMALTLVGSLLDADRHGAEARFRYLAVGLLLGAAFWQQPVALAYLGTAATALALRPRGSRRDPWTLAAVLGFVIGALPVLLFNLANDWASSGLLGRDRAELRAQAEVLPSLVARTVRVAFPILAGLSPGHPWSGVPGLRFLAAALVPLVLLGYLWTKRRALTGGARGGRSAAALPVLLSLWTAALFWATAAGRINERPRYLLPLLAAAALELGVVLGAVQRRSSLAAAALAVPIVALNVAGTLPRLGESAAIEAYWRGVVRSLDEKGIRSGYSDFGIAAPVTMFTAERITLSARLGPTPAYYSELQERRVARAEQNAFILPKGDDPRAFAELLRVLGVRYRMVREPVVVFWELSRKVELWELAGFRAQGRLVPGEDE